jgi:hypothetical protein
MGVTRTISCLLRYPVDEVVLAVRKNTPEADIVSNAVAERKTATRASLPRIHRSPLYLAVHRFDNSVYYRRIDREAFLLLAALRDGHSITTAIEKAFAQSRQQPEQQASKIREYFAHAAELGRFTATEPDRA